MNQPPALLPEPAPGRVVRCRNPACRRLLTDPRSRALGYGPDCAQAAGLIPPRAPAAPLPRPTPSGQPGPDLLALLPHGSDAMPTTTWIRNPSTCVEVAYDGDDVLVRDGRNPGGPALRFTAAEWAAFVDGVDAGEFTAVTTHLPAEEATP